MRVPRRKKVDVKRNKSTQGLLRKCQPPAWQRSPGGIGKQKRERRSAMPRRRERSRRRSRGCNRVQGRKGKKKQYCPRHHVEAEGNGAKEGQSTLLHRTLAKKERECQGGQSLAVILFLPHSDCGSSCLTEPSVFRIVDPQGRTEFCTYSRAATGQHKIARQVVKAMAPK